MELQREHGGARAGARAITGQTLDEVIAERILSPLKMTDTRWWVDAEDANRMAAPACEPG